jgi:tetratricopeptide (TPR) repeat protein
MGEENISHARYLVNRLIENLIFDRTSKWFRQELIQKCFEGDIDKEERRGYHGRAADFYDSNDDNDVEINSYEKSIGLAYHLHNAGRHKESYEHNRRLAQLASNYGNLDLVERCYLRAIIDSRELGRIDEEMKCILNLSRNVYMYWKNRENEAKSHYDNVLKYSVHKKDYNLQALVLLELVNYYNIVKNDYDEALTHLEHYFKIIQQLQPTNQLGLAVGYCQKAALLKRKQKYDEAFAYYINGLELFAKNLVEVRSQGANIQYETSSVDIPLYLFDSYYNIGDIHRIRREYSDALEFFTKSLSVAENLGNKLAIAETLDGIATVYYELGDYDQALKKYKERLTIEEGLYHHTGIALTIGYIGRIYIKKNMYEQAREYLRRACSMLKEVDHHDDAQKFQEDLLSI